MRKAPLDGVGPLPRSEEAMASNLLAMAPQPITSLTITRAPFAQVRNVAKAGHGRAVVGDTRAVWGRVSPRSINWEKWLE